MGGAGKSALAFEVVRRARSKARQRVLPIVVDEDWDGPLQAHVAALLRVGNRLPTPSMIETLGVAGRLLVIVDSLSERGTGDAVERVGKAARSGAFLHLVVTARGPAPDSASFQDFAAIETRPLTPDRLPDFVAIYAPEVDQNAILEKLRPLIDEDKPLSPLFARFAIEQTAGAGATLAPTQLEIVLRYLEELRTGRVDLGADDFVRAATVSAFGSVKEALSPREIGADYLRGVLDHEADRLPFMNAAGATSVTSAVIIDQLESCGLLMRNPVNRRLQFAYDPVAEILAAKWMIDRADEAGIVQLRQRLAESPEAGLGLAKALKDAEQVLAA